MFTGGRGRAASNGVFTAETLRKIAGAVLRFRTSELLEVAPLVGIREGNGVSDARTN